MSLQILYADTLFLSNFIMNLLSFTLTGTVMHLTTKRRRLLLASFLGGGYSVLAVVLSFPGALHITVGVLLSVILVLIAFGASGRGKSFFLRTFILFYFSSILLGGGIEALFSLLEGAFGARADFILRPADAVLVIGFSAYFLLHGIVGMLSGGDAPYSVSVRIVYGERTVTLPLLVDSGCMLTDPLSGKGAILVSADSLRTVLPPEILAAARCKRITLPREHALAGRCRLLPMRGVGSEKLLLAFRPTSVVLLEDGGSLDVWVALCTERGTRFGGCHGLFPATLLCGRKASGKMTTRKQREA